MQLANGSRIISLPGDEGTIRGYSGVALVVIDESSRVDDALYYAVRPFLAVSRGRLVCLSTPFGKRGFFFEEFTGNNPWERVEIPATQCPRISEDFLAQERLALGERWFRQEYCCSFEETIDSVFSRDDIMAALENDIPPLLIGWEPSEEETLAIAGESLPLLEHRMDCPPEPVPEPPKGFPLPAAFNVPPTQLSEKAWTRIPHFGA
jgi:hypothetical protein